MPKKKSNRFEKLSWLSFICFFLIFTSVIFYFACVRKFSDSAIMFIILLIGFSLEFVILDFAIFKLRSNETESDNSDCKHVYHPNIRIWALGLILGLGTNIIYLFGREITSNSSISTNNILKDLNQIDTNYFTANIVKHWHSIASTYNFALLFLLGILLCFIIWAIVKITESI